MSKRAGPPLFELLRKQSESAPPAPPAPPAPTPRREPDPHVPWSGAAVTRAERSAATFEDQPRQTGEIRVPMNRVYMAVALALALVIGAWAVGYSVGAGGARRAQINQAVADEQVVAPVRTPGGTDTAQTQGGGPLPGPVAGAGNSQPRPGPAAQTLTPGSPWVLVSGGSRSVDPRTPGVNYLELATLPADQALDAIDFMASKGVRVVGVAVDSGGRNANNPDRYRLVSLGLAVPSGQFRTTQNERRDHARLIATIGAEWKRERQGGSDFSQTLWSRYDP